MTVSLADLPEQLRTAVETVDVVDETGRVVGYFQPVRLAPPGWAKAHSPTTREEIERRRAEYRRTGEGRTLDEIWKRIHDRYGEGRS